MLLGAGLSASTVVAILEFVLAVYSGALFMNAKNKSLKILHVIITLFWIALAVLNLAL